MRCLVAALLLLAGLSGCSSPNLPDYVQLGDLRILALDTVAPSQPEVNPGTSVTLQPIVSDLNGGGRALSFTVETCPDPGISYGATPTCQGTPDYQTTPAPITLTGVPNGTYTGLAPQFSITVPSTVLTGQSPVAQFNGVAYLVFYTVTASDGTTVQSFRRIIASAPGKTTKDSDPVITGVTGNGNALSTTAVNTMPTIPLDLAITYDPNATTTYQTMQSDGSLVSAVESFTTTWFFSDGSLDYDRSVGTGTDNWTPPSPPPAGRAAIFVVVTRDGRGGENYQFLSFE
jgi:hypothetical protein